MGGDRRRGADAARVRKVRRKVRSVMDMLEEAIQ